MTRKTQFTGLLILTSLCLLAGCSGNKKTISKDEGTNKEAKKILSDSFNKFNQENLRELTIANSDGSSETTYTWNSDLTSYLETGIVTDSSGNMTSTARILSQQHGTNYVFYQPDALLENGVVNENAGYVRTLDSKNDYKFCENTLILALSDSATVGKSSDESLDGVECTKIAVSDPTNGDVTYWVDKKNGYPVQYQTGTQITTYRYGEASCMSFEIPSEYTEE